MQLNILSPYLHLHFNCHRMADSGDALTLHGCGGRHERTGRGEEQPANLSARQQLQQVPRQYGCAAPAAGAACMHILRFHVINQKSAVRIGRSEIDAVLLKQIGHNALADPAKVAGDDHIIILRCAPGVRKVCLQRLIGGRRHRRAHVVEILDAGIRDLPGRNRSHLGRKWKKD